MRSAYSYVINWRNCIEGAIFFAFITTEANPISPLRISRKKAVRSRSMYFMISKRTRGSKATKIILAKRKRNKKLRKLVKPLQGRDRETRPIRSAIPRTHPSLGYAAPRVR